MNKLILVTNDDSIHAKGIKELIAVAKLFGQVVVVARKTTIRDGAYHNNQ